MSKLALTERLIQSGKHAIPITCFVRVPSSQSMYDCVYLQCTNSRALLLTYQKHSEKCQILGAGSTWPILSSIAHSVGRGAFRFLCATFTLAAPDSEPEATDERTVQEATDSGRRYKKELTMFQYLQWVFQKNCLLQKVTNREEAVTQKFPFQSLHIWCRRAQVVH